MSGTPSPTIRAAEWRADEEVVVVDRERPELEPGQARLAVTHCGICGSDLHSYRHGFAVRPGQVLGHEFSARVLEAPGVDGLAVGDRVTVRPLIPCGTCTQCRRGAPQLCENGLGQSLGYGAAGAFAQEVVVPRAVVGETVFLLPDTVSDRAGALVEPLAVAFRAVGLAIEGGAGSAIGRGAEGDGGSATDRPLAGGTANGRAAEADGSTTTNRPLAGGTVLVSGAGPIGLGAVAALRLAGAETIIVADPSPLRRARAEQLGATVTIDPLADDVVRTVRKITGPGVRGRGGKAVAAIDCAGAPGTLKACIESCGAGGVVVIAAVGNPPAEIRPDWLVERELVLRGSYGYDDEFPRVIAALAGGEIDAEALISHDLPLERIQDAFRIQLDAASSAKVLVTP